MPRELTMPNSMSVSIKGARHLARLWQGANGCQWEPHHPLSLEIPYPAATEPSTQSYGLASGEDPQIHGEKIMLASLPFTDR